MGQERSSVPGLVLALGGPANTLTSMKEREGQEDFSVLLQRFSSRDTCWSMTFAGESGFCWHSPECQVDKFILSFRPSSGKASSCFSPSGHFPGASPWKLVMMTHVSNVHFYRIPPPSVSPPLEPLKYPCSSLSSSLYAQMSLKVSSVSVSLPTELWFLAFSLDTSPAPADFPGGGS